VDGRRDQRRGDAVFLLFYRELFFIALDERAARLAGVPVGAVNFAFRS
jgi:ABC-type Mn2+/Zn2+ transport system permease subunit